MILVLDDFFLYLSFAYPFVDTRLSNCYGFIINHDKWKSKYSKLCMYLCMYMSLFFPKDIRIISSVATKKLIVF